MKASSQSLYLLFTLMYAFFYLEGCKTLPRSNGMTPKNVVELHVAESNKRSDCLTYTFSKVSFEKITLLDALNLLSTEIDRKVPKRPPAFGWVASPLPYHDHVESDQKTNVSFSGTNVTLNAVLDSLMLQTGWHYVRVPQGFIDFREAKN